MQVNRVRWQDHEIRKSDKGKMCKVKYFRNIVDRKMLLTFGGHSTSEPVGWAVENVNVRVTLTISV